MNPDVVRAIDDLESSGTLSRDQAFHFGRVARSELVSLHTELRLVAYAGVLLIMAGVGVVVHDNLEHIGPTAIAGALTLGALASFIWVARSAPAFGWSEVPSPHLALDYVLLLGALLAGADLAYIEATFTPLGNAWTWHLLFVSIFYLALAFRYDSRIVLSLALSTFIAWRGVSTTRLGDAFFRATEDDVRANAVACGVLFLATGWILRSRALKAHFEPVFIHMGWLLILGAAASGVAESYAFALVLLGLAGIVAVVGYRQGRFSLLAFGIVAAYIGVSALVVRIIANELCIFWFALTPLIVVALLFVSHRFIREPA